MGPKGESQARLRPTFMYTASFRPSWPSLDLVGFLIKEQAALVYQSYHLLDMCQWLFEILVNLPSWHRRSWLFRKSRGLWEEPLLWPRLKFLDVVNFLLSLLLFSFRRRHFKTLLKTLKVVFFACYSGGPESEFLNFADYTECIFNSSGSSKTRSITFCFFKYCEYKIDILNMSEEEASFACCCMPFKRTWLTQFRLLRLCTNCIACCIQ